ncbi:MAG: GNAT family N-acetyltransferase, partial [Verrucomicrobiia bacterium]
PGDRPGGGSHFRPNALLLGPGVRDRVASGWADYTPSHLSDIPALFRSRLLEIDVALISVSPPDPHGFCSLGIHVDVIPSAIAAAKHVIAEIQPEMPRTHGQSFVHLSSLHTLVQARQPLLQWHPPPTRDDAQAIARFVAGLIDDGATLHLTPGRLGTALCQALSGHRHLGIHTESFSDALLPLLHSGALDGSRKTLLPGKIVASSCMGSAELYRTVHDHPAFEFRPTDFVNDPATIARNRGMVSIQSAFQIDLTGQAAAESLSGRILSGFGGQADFFRGAAKSEGGKTILALPSTAKNGTVSRIVPHLEPGTGVVLTRADIQWVVTEFGVADLRGRSLRERAIALIHLAHPAFREELLQAARQAHLVHPEQISLPRNLQPYPFRYETTRTFPGGLTLNFRPIKPTDEKALQALFYSHSAETILQRYFIPLQRLPHRQKQQFVTVNYDRDMAIVGYPPDQPGRLVCVGRFLAEEDPAWCEVAFTVHDDYQRRGLGTFLLQYLASIARDRGITGFTATFLATNHGMLRTFKKVVPHLKPRLVDGTYTVRFNVADVRPLPKTKPRPPPTDPS